MIYFGHTLRNLCQCTKFARVIKVSEVLAFHFTTPFSDCLQIIYNGAFSAKILNDFKLLTIFPRKASSQMFDWVENRLLAEGLKY